MDTLQDWERFQEEQNQQTTPGDDQENNQQTQANAPLIDEVSDPWDHQNIATMKTADYSWLHDEEEQEEQDREKYMKAMTKRASTHAAKEYKFNVTVDAPVNDGRHSPPKKPQKTGGSKKQESASSRKEAMQKDLWEPFRKDLSTPVKPGECPVEAFQKIQTKIEEKLEKNDQCCKKLIVALQAHEKKLANDFSCPHTGSDSLFTKLELQHLKSNKPDLIKQVDTIKSLDRNLGQQVDPRCVGFSPTELQKRILDKIDSGRSFIVRAPASTGKTMITQYLILRSLALHPDKKVLYICPKKPLCNEYSLFTTNLKQFQSSGKKQILKFAIGTEDFFNWKEMLESNIMICTPAIFWKLLLFPQHGIDFTKQVASVIFDEFPDCLKNFRETASLLPICSAFGWQTLMLSATFPDAEIDLLRSIFPSIMESDVLEPAGSIKPVDTFIYKYDHTADSLKKVDTSSTYSPSLTSAEDRIPRALRVPISLDEFHTLFHKAVSSTPQQDLSALPMNRCFKGVDVTSFALSCASPVAAPRCSSDGYPAMPTSEEVYKLIRNLEKNNLLPVMFFLNDPHMIDVYHDEVSQLVEKSLTPTRQTKSKHNHTKAEKDDERYDTIDSGLVSNSLGGLNDENMTNIFPHYSDRKGAEGTQKYKFGFRGRNVKASEHFQGLSLGLGIHHHGINKNVREATEAGLRLGDLKVVFCDYSMAVGLNMPIKTVAIIGDGVHLPPADFVQAAGRAGRWKTDRDGGAVVFVNFPDSRIQEIWDPIEPPKELFAFPLNPTILLSLIASHRSIRNVFFTNLACNMNIPQWGWNPTTYKTLIRENLNILVDLGLATRDEATCCPQLTPAGTCALALAAEDKVAFFAGWCLRGTHLATFCNLIKSKKDFLYVVSHFLRPWRTQREDGPTLSSVPVSEDLREFMAAQCQVALHTFDPSKDFVPTDQITALYTLVFPMQDWMAFMSASDFNSYIAHFIKKIEIFQKAADLPWGSEALEDLKKLINHQ